jgi:NhaA family Na+:H+ antiporter
MFGVLPLFALIALAIPLDSGVNLDSPITHGILLRPLGKVLGITFGVLLAIWLSKRRGFPELRISDFVRISVLGGIGFTVALFVSESVYGSGSSSQATANISTLLVTILCVAIGAVLLRTRKPNQAGATNS